MIDDRKMNEYEENFLIVFHYRNYVIITIITLCFFVYVPAKSIGIKILDLIVLLVFLWYALKTYLYAFLKNNKMIEYFILKM